ncbi:MULTISPECIES: TetR/AcrR family transcriptional regulator [Pseudomonas]|uniref:HTH-type transcriptional regulator BetI n=1 Tax=Pseudomonas fluorescens TaxID=294 RepID=A0A5E6SU19_PSEFL|nr:MULTISPECIES: TetR family transcriptional regulator C-terminal domain-containing protein [Pseudomonas]VVM80895.1 HTH-type transcriptional regulator BetI [Pseudomonas fluorescens]
MAISREAPTRTRRKAGAAVSNNERKRQEVLEATWRAILRVGVENVTIREIAAELQATTGAVVHYFRTKDEVLLYALDHLISGMVEEVTQRLEGVEGIARLECILHASLPLDEEGETAWRIWLAFLRTSVGNDKLGMEHQRRYSFMRNALVDELTRLQAQKAIRDGLDLSLEADAMIALADGLGVGRVIDSQRLLAQQQRMLVKRHFEAFLMPQE